MYALDVAQTVGGSEQDRMRLTAEPLTVTSKSSTAPRVSANMRAKGPEGFGRKNFKIRTQ